MSVCEPSDRIKLDIEGGPVQSNEHLQNNIRSCLERGLPELEPYIKLHDGKFVIVGSAPSVLDKESLKKIRALKKKGAFILCVNSAHDILRSRGIHPHCHFLMDASDQTLKFVKKPQKKVRYLVGSMCDPQLFDRLAGYDVTVTHILMNRGELEVLRDRDLARKDKGLPQLPSMCIPGGSTAALRAIMVGMNMGYREFHMFGVDSAYTGEQTHADRDETHLLNTQRVGVVREDGTAVEFSASSQMAIQASDFEKFLNAYGPSVQMFVYGRGLIPELWRIYCDSKDGRPKRRAALLQEQGDGQGVRTDSSGGRGRLHGPQGDAGAQGPLPA